MDLELAFSNMANAPLNSKGTYMGEGIFLTESKVLKLKEGFKGKSFIYEFEILESTNPAHPVGSSGSQVIKLDKPQAFGDIKAIFFALAMGLDPKQVRSPEADPETHKAATDFFKAAVDPAYAAKLGVAADEFIGLKAKLETVKVKTRANTDFTVHNWSPVAEAAVEQQAAA